MVGWPSAASRRSGFSRIHLNRVSGLIGLLTYGAYGLLNDAWLNGHAEEHLVPFWGRFGFKPMDAPRFVFSGHRFVEIECDLEPHVNPLTMHKDPMVLIRPESEWDRRGVLNRSVIRPATNPISRS